MSKEEPEQQMIIQDEIDLDEKMCKLMQMDGTVLAAYKTGELLGISKMKIYMSMVLLLAQEKKIYFGMALDAKNREMPDHFFKESK